MEEIKTTPAQENYIESIYLMSRSKPVRASELAENLGVKRASVSKFISSLVNEGFVHHESHGDIILTDKGTELAKAIIRRDHCLTRLLVDVCGMPAEQAFSEVHRLEHVISDEVLIRLEILVDFACSSEAWLKRLQYRIKTAQTDHSSEQALQVGQTPVHPRQSIDK